MPAPSFSESLARELGPDVEVIVEAAALDLIAQHGLAELFRAMAEAAAKRVRASGIAVIKVAIACQRCPEDDREGACLAVFNLSVKGTARQVTRLVTELSHEEYSLVRSLAADKRMVFHSLFRILATKV